MSLNVLNMEGMPQDDRSAEGVAERRCVNGDCQGSSEEVYRCVMQVVSARRGVRGSVGRSIKCYVITSWNLSPF